MLPILLDFLKIVISPFHWSIRLFIALEKCVCVCVCVSFNFPKKFKSLSLWNECHGISFVLFSSLLSTLAAWASAGKSHLKYIVQHSNSSSINAAVPLRERNTLRQVKKSIKHGITLGWHKWKKRHDVGKKRNEDRRNEMIWKEIRLPVFKSISIEFN